MMSLPDPTSKTSWCGTSIRCSRGTCSPHFNDCRVKVVQEKCVKKVVYVTLKGSKLPQPPDVVREPLGLIYLTLNSNPCLASKVWF